MSIQITREAFPFVETQKCLSVNYP